MSDILDLNGRNALVTGVGRGIGRHVVGHLAGHNAGGIVINDYYQERAEAAAAELKAGGATCKLLPMGADAANAADVQRMVATAEQELGGPIQILVNNAGVPAAVPQKRFVDSEPAEWVPWVNLNLYGVMYCTHAVLRGMIASRYGRIVTVGSEAGRVPMNGLTIYGAAKAGAAGFMRCLAREVGPFGITCNTVAPGATRTPAVDELWGDAVRYRKVLKQYLLPRLGEPADIANMILFLCSDAASWITGQTYPVNGGLSCAL